MSKKKGLSAEVSNDRITTVTVFDVRGMSCTDAECDTPDAPVVTVIHYSNHMYNGTCAKCFIRLMDRIEAASDLVVRTTFDKTYVDGLRRLANGGNSATTRRLRFPAVDPVTAHALNLRQGKLGRKRLLRFLQRAFPQVGEATLDEIAVRVSRIPPEQAGYQFLCHTLTDAEWARFEAGEDVDAVMIDRLSQGPTDA
jgi:hypothetical protein